MTFPKELKPNSYFEKRLFPLYVSVLYMIKKNKCICIDHNSNNTISKNNSHLFLKGKIRFCGSQKSPRMALKLLKVSNPCFSSCRLTNSISGFKNVMFLDLFSIHSSCVCVFVFICCFDVIRAQICAQLGHDCIGRWADPRVTGCLCLCFN